MHQMAPLATSGTDMLYLCPPLVCALSLPKGSKLSRSSLIKPVLFKVNFARLVEHFFDAFHQEHNFFQILYTFLMIVEPSDAQNPSVLIFF